MSRGRFLLLLFVLGALGACASAGIDPNELPSDAGPSDADTLGAFGDPCSDADQCASALCVAAEEGGDGFCSTDCSEGCPSSYACASNACVPAVKFLCKSCESDSECGGEGNRCLDYEGGSFCGADCANAGDSCPAGFSCEVVTAGETSLGLLCVSDSGFCCIDEDGDFRGAGDDCRSTDCDESDPDIYDDAAEVCDGKDNDCLDGTDVGVTDCAAADCRLTSNGFVMRAAETCLSAACAAQPDVSCGLYACEGGAAEGDTCATSCDGEDNIKCDDAAHCDASACLADLGDSNACNETSDCTSGHCQNDFCCEFGDCCQVASDCPSFGSFDPVCEDPRTCQGAKGAALCTAGFTCATTGVEQDDSACGAQTVANDCGFFLPVFCNGQVDQNTPTCPTTCGGNADCDANAYCDDVSDTCVADLDEGLSCGGDGECESGHCQNGFCCLSGDCCESASDCPGAYSGAPTCTVASACQGQRDLAVCVDSECDTLNNSPDDSACDAGTIADTCGPYPSLSCTGNIVQNDPVCATSCSGDTECDNNAYCNAQGQCEFDEVNGSVCTRDSQCGSGHCENGFCCATGDCCADAGDCSHFDIAADCDSQATCQGSRTDGVCNANSQCSSVVAQDDSACSGLPTEDCGPYPGLTCTSDPGQPSNQLGLCATSCSIDSECDASAHCDGGQCVPDAGQGGFCTGQSDCSGGLTCVDSVCCATACSGSCQACDLPGSIGTCNIIASGQDPDAECGAVDCTSFYFGWQGDTCFEKASLSAAGATCGGDGACGSTVEECTAQTIRGTAELTCDSTCQSPNLASCTGTTAGSCNNLDLGDETCGDGVCEVTTQRCVAGAPQTCVPNSAAATGESCDGLDNDCNGGVDDGLPTDAYELNNSCANKFFLGTLQEGTNRSFSDMTLYTTGDEDWYRQLTSEAFTTCTTGVDETYEYTVTMTPPAGQDYDLQLCFNSFSDSSCTLDCLPVSELGGDQQEFVGGTWSGPCGGGTNDGLNFFIRVYPFAGASSCQPYTLQTSFAKTN